MAPVISPVAEPLAAPCSGSDPRPPSWLRRAALGSLGQWFGEKCTLVYQRSENAALERGLDSITSARVAALFARLLVCTKRKGTVDTRREVV